MFGKGFAFLFVLILTMSVLAQEKREVAQEKDNWLDRYGLTKEWRQKDQPPVIFSRAGEQRKKVRGQRTEPKLVVDTARFSGGSALITLNRFPGGRRESVSATASQYLRLLSVYGENLPISVDSIVRSRTNDSLTLYSSDTGTVEIMLLVQ